MPQFHQSMPGGRKPFGGRDEDDLIREFDSLVDNYQEAARCKGIHDRAAARSALRHTYRDALDEAFAMIRLRAIRAALNCANQIDPDGPQPIGYVSADELDNIQNDDVQAYIDPTPVPNGMPVWIHAPLTTAALCKHLTEILGKAAAGADIDIDAEARAILEASYGR